jgi:hypothetical protein
VFVEVYDAFGNREVIGRRNLVEQFKNEFQDLCKDVELAHG